MKFGNLPGSFLREIGRGSDSAVYKRTLRRF